MQAEKLKAGLFILSLVMELLSIGIAVVRSRQHGKTRILSPRVILLGGTFMTATVLFFGLDYMMHADRNGFMRLVLSVHNSISLFVVDISPGEFLYAAEAEGAASLAEMLGHPAYICFIGGLFVLAPCLTFDLVLSFFGNTYAHFRLMLNIFREKCIFSELNERSVALAESICETDALEHGWKRRRRARKIIFNNVTLEKGSASEALIERARAIDAILFKKSETAINYRVSVGRLSFFIMGQNHEENVKAAARVRDIYGDSGKVTLYIFSSSVMAELFAGEKKNEEIEIRRINEPRSLIYRTLYDMETERLKSGAPDLFTRAKEDGAVRRISVVIVGLGEYGEEMLKALTWFCQMDGYKVRIEVFAEEASAEKRLNARYPELLKKSSPDADDPGDAQYEMIVHPDTDVESVEFADRIRAMKDVTYAFVALGSDEVNISVAVSLRRLFEQSGMRPLIHAALFNSDKAKMLYGSRNGQDEEYDIEYVGDLKSLYSDQVIINSDLEREALGMHMQCFRSDEFEGMSGQRRELEEKRIRRKFYMHEYNYRSSMATALHEKARMACGLYGEDGKADVEALSRLEHRRWNAYMRTEGYSFSGSMDRSSRTDMGRLHNLMVPFSKLPENEVIKDVRITSGSAPEVRYEKGREVKGEDGDGV